MVAYIFDVFINIWIKILARLSLKMSPLYRIEHVRNHADRGKRLPHIIEIYSPRITCAFGKNLKRLFRGMIPPNTPINFGSLLLGIANFTHIRMRKYTMTTVQPSVRSPTNVVQNLMCIMHTPTIK